MARHFSTKDFFRQIPNTLLARYFYARNLFSDLDFSTMKETKPDALFNAWIALPESQRSEMDAEFREILEMSDEKGFRAIIDEAEWHLGKELIRKRAMTLRTRATAKSIMPLSGDDSLHKL